MINLAHSLHGNMETNMVQSLRFASFLFRMAFISAWQTKGYFVFRIEPSADFLAQGRASSLQFLGKPL